MKFNPMKFNPMKFNPMKFNPMKICTFAFLIMAISPLPAFAETPALAEIPALAENTGEENAETFIITETIYKPCDSPTKVLYFNYQSTFKVEYVHEHHLETVFEGSVPDTYRDELLVDIENSFCRHENIKCIYLQIENTKE